MAIGRPKAKHLDPSSAAIKHVEAFLQNPFVLFKRKEVWAKLVKYVIAAVLFCAVVRLIQYFFFERKVKKR